MKLQSRFRPCHGRLDGLRPFGAERGCRVRHHDRGAEGRAATKTIDTCGTCHGVNGRSVSPTFPNLAAQTAPYIEAQLHAFKDQSRADPDAQAYMWGMASQLSDPMISALAGYFAAQPPRRRKAGECGAHRAG